MSWLLDRFGFLLRVRAGSDREAAEKLIASINTNAPQGGDPTGRSA